ncbi:MAG: FmdB family zinc ribbon protein [Candidatus Bipolaricaulaceae bacterium]
MPIYRFRCDRCGTEFRELVRNGDPRVRCPGCGADAVTRLLSRFGVIYKGSGFYTTDYRRKSDGGKASEKS